MPTRNGRTIGDKSSNIRLSMLDQVIVPVTTRFRVKYNIRIRNKVYLRSHVRTCIGSASVFGLAGTLDGSDRG